MKTNKKPFTGLHVLGEISTTDEKKLKSLIASKQYIHKIIKNRKK